MPRASNTRRQRAKNYSPSFHLISLSLAHLFLSTQYAHAQPAASCNKDKIKWEPDKAEQPTMTQGRMKVTTTVSEFSACDVTVDPDADACKCPCGSSLLTLDLSFTVGEQCLTNAGALGVIPEPCLEAIAAGDGREVMKFDEDRDRTCMPEVR